jgi:hypothetical protein
MEGFFRFLALVRADLLERVRSLRFWLLFALISGAAWWCFPPVDATYMILGIAGQYRGAYSSAWIGMALSMLCIWLSLLGFYMVRGTLVRDIETRVWQLLVATPMRRSTYLLSKWFSHVLVLSLVLGAAAVVGIVAQLVRAEDSSLDLFELAKPLLLLALPTLGVTSMFAVVFDLVPWLRRTAGNVLYFVLWIVMLATTQLALQGNLDLKAPAQLIGDPFGVTVFDRSVRQGLLTQAGVQSKPGFCLACGMNNKTPKLITWGAWQVDGRDVAGRVIWLAGSLFVVMLSARLLDWAAAFASPAAAASQSGRRLRWLGALLQPLRRSTGGTLLAVELELALRQRKAWWWGAIALAWGFQLMGKQEISVLAVLAAWLLSLDVFSRVVLREHDGHTGPVVFSAASAGRRILLARWTMLVVIGLATGLPALLRYCMAAPGVALAILCAVLSIATWALALGALTRNARTFELLMAALAYLAIDRLPVLNLGADPQLTVVLHLALLPVAVATLMLSWPRLQRNSYK